MCIAAPRSYNSCPICSEIIYSVNANHHGELDHFPIENVPAYTDTELVLIDEEEDVDDDEDWPDMYDGYEEDDDYDDGTEEGHNIMYD